MPIYRSDEAFISVSVNGVGLDAKSWDYAEGGDLQPEMQTYNPGGMKPAKAVGGLRKRSDMTVRRAWSEPMIGAFTALDKVSGIAEMAIGFQTMTANRKGSAGQQITYTGILGKVARPNYDSHSSGIVYLELTMSCDENLKGQE